MPIPARPSIATTRPAPETAAATTACSAATSASRSSSGQLETWTSMRRLGIRGWDFSRWRVGERGKLEGQARDLELEEPLGPVEVRECRRPEIEQPELTGQVVPDEVRGRAREQHLPAMTRIADAGGLVNGEAHVAVRADAGLAGVQSHADAHLHLVRPLMLGERDLRGGAGLDRRAGAAEDDEERVALRVDLDAAALGEGRAQELVMRREHVAVAVAASFLSRRVEPSMSVNRKVTVPVGRAVEASRTAGVLSLDPFRQPGIPDCRAKQGNLRGRV